MQPRSHRLAIRLAHARGAGAVPVAALLAGSDDEDVYRWPLGLRTPAIGFTHSCRPGSRFGELGFPSSRLRCARLFERARAAWPRDPARAGALLGRACHLLADAAVPARARGVWHYLGDPLEAWIERHLDEVAALPPEEAAPAPPGDLVERLARLAAVHPADGTRTLTGALARRLGRRPLEPSLVEAQARLLFPQAVAHLAALLDRFAGAA